MTVPLVYSEEHWPSCATIVPCADMPGEIRNLSSAGCCIIGFMRTTARCGRRRKRCTAPITREPAPRPPHDVGQQPTRAVSGPAYWGKAGHVAETMGVLLLAKRVRVASDPRHRRGAPGRTRATGKCLIPFRGGQRGHCTALGEKNPRGRPEACQAARGLGVPAGVGRERDYAARNPHAGLRGHEGQREPPGPGGEAGPLNARRGRGPGWPASQAW